ncbi:MAG TPA: hypothetical protein VK731_05210, partial [Candidatus Cybelea sp.]|nr:hypothetical protein [Candidatus Cybelea sp.]
IPDLKPLGLECFIRKPTVGRGGDLAVCIGREGELPETQGVIFRPREPLQPLHPILRPSPEGQSGPIVTQNPAKNGKVILFRDSFASAWIPFIGYHFNQAIYLPQRVWDRAMLEREKPDVVIDEIVERKFNNQAPLELLAADQKTSAAKALSGPADTSTSPLAEKTVPNRPTAKQ